VLQGLRAQHAAAQQAPGAAAGRAGARNALLQHGLLYLAIKEVFEETDDQVTFKYHCTMLQHNERCGIYEDRPPMCHHYQVGADEMCVFYEPKETP